MENENANKKNLFSIGALILSGVSLITAIIAYFILNEPVKGSTVVKLWGETNNTIATVALIISVVALVAAIVGIVNKAGGKGIKIAAIVVAIVILLGTAISSLAVGLLVRMTKHFNGDKDALSFIEDEETLKNLDNTINEIIREAEKNNK